MHGALGREALSDFFLGDAQPDENDPNRLA